MKNPKFVEKTCPTCNKLFKVSFYKRKVQRFCSKKCAQHHPETLDKMAESQRKTYNLLYGGKHPMQTKGVLLNFRKSMIEKHGVSHPSKMKNHKDRVKKTLLMRYGDENYNNAEKSRKTCVTKYGVDNFTKTAEYKERTKNTCLLKYGVDHPSKTRQFKLSHSKNMFEKFLNSERFKHFEPDFSVDQYKGVTRIFNQKYSFKCKRCKMVREYFIDDGKGPVCPYCDKENMSFFQKEVVDYVRSLISDNSAVVVNDLSVLYPKELDVFVPDKKLAIECNGLYWHSECLGKKNKVYHLNKMRQCLLKEIHLIQIWDDEWKLKKDIVKSVLSNLLSSGSNKKVYGRNCKLLSIDKEECDEFLVKNHLQGKDVSSIRIGLYENKELVSVMTFCKSRFDRKLEWEMSRFCNKIGVNVIGGASKLFKYFVKTYSPKEIVSYSDRRFFTGNLYTKLGFLFIQNTSPNYFYIMGNYTSLRNRMSFQKHKLKNLLENFDPSLTEWENMKNHGYDRIWDCGNSKWVWQSSDGVVKQSS